MFSKIFEQRLSEWHNFRKKLESSPDPIQDTIHLYQLAPKTTMNCDPWDSSTWLDPWELLYENLYCEYCILLGICYTLQLTDNLTYKNFEIHISIDRKFNDRHYLLRIDDRIIGYDQCTHIHIDNLPSSLHSEVIYPMTKIE